MHLPQKYLAIFFTFKICLIMFKIIVVSDLSNLTASDLTLKADTAATGIEKHADQLPNADPEPGALRIMSQGLKDKLALASNLESQLAEVKRQIELNANELSLSLKGIGNYLETVVNKTQNPSLVSALGYRVRETGSTINELEVPTDLALIEVKNTSGMLRLRLKAVDKARNYGVIWFYGETPPTVWPDEAMKVVANSRGNKLKFNRGERVWVRIKAYGPNNTESDWSEVDTRIVP